MSEDNKLLSGIPDGFKYIFELRKDESKNDLFFMGIALVILIMLGVTLNDLNVRIMTGAMSIFTFLGIVMGVNR